MKKGKVIFWIIFGLALVGVVLTILFVSLFGAKNTEALAKSFNSYSTGEGYLSKDSDRYKKIDEYLDLLDGKVTDTENKNLVQNYKKTYEASVVIAQFFNNEIYFMKYTETYKKQRKEIENLLKKAQNSVDNCLKQIEKNKNVSGESEFWNAIAFNNIGGFMTDFRAQTLHMFTLLADVYQDGVSSKIMNNDYSKAMFVGLKSLTKEVNEGFSKNGIGQKYLTFINAYFADEKIVKIMNYTYANDAAKKTIVDDIIAKGSESEYYDYFIAGSI